MGQRNIETRITNLEEAVRPPPEPEPALAGHDLSKLTCNELVRLEGMFKQRDEAPDGYGCLSVPELEELLELRNGQAAIAVGCLISPL